MLLRVLLLCMAASRVAAHINLLYPLPINSKNDPQTPEAQKDYSMTAPLMADGSNWPAKGYATKENVDALKPVATLVAGEEFTWTTEGTATHNGGSCQVAISYDLLATSAVMASWIGECPMSGSYTFTVPDIPGSEKALFLWIWLNKTGNREMYSNAAVVAVSGTAKSFTGPSPFRANTFADGSCVNAEGTDQGFPNPGEQVIYGGDEAGGASKGQELADCSWDNNSDVTVTSDGTSAEAPASSEGVGDATTGAGGAATTGGGATTNTGGAEGSATSGGAGEGASSGGGGGAVTSSGAAAATISKAAATTSKAATSAATGGTAAATAAVPSSTSSDSSSSSDTIGGFTYKEVGIAFGFAVLAAFLAVLIVCLSKRKGGSHDSDAERGGGGRRRRNKRRKHKYSSARRSDTDTESSATGSSEGSETDESTDDEKGRRRRK